MLQANIFTTYDLFESSYNGYYTYWAGTSFAAPHVTGTAALMLTANPNLYAFDIEQIIKRTGPLWPSCNSGIGCGMLNAENAVKRVIAPYTVTHGNAAFNKISTNATWTFTASPVTGVAAGQYKVDRYELKILTGHQYSQTPWAWMGPPEKGLSAANPNNASPYLQELITPTSQSLTTYFYFIRTVLASGATVDKWAPFDPTVYKRGGVYKYTVVGTPIPLAVNITGPTDMTWHQAGTLTANPSGGAGGYTYVWQFRPGGTGSWITAGTAQTQAVTMTWTQGVEFKVVVTSNGSTAEDTHFITYCPTLCNGPIRGNAPVYALDSPYPNPFNPTTDLRFSLAETGHALLVVYDVTGREVVRLVDGTLEAGSHEYRFEASHLPSGVYLARLTAGDFTATRRIVLAK